MSEMADCGVHSWEQPSIEPYLVECKFTVESKEFNGGDFEKNIGGGRKDKRISFEGYATNELYKAVMDSVRDISSN